MSWGRLVAHSILLKDSYKPRSQLHFMRMIKLVSNEVSNINVYVIILHVKSYFILKDLLKI